MSILPGELTDMNTLVKWPYTKNNSYKYYDRVEVHTSIGLVKLIAWNEHNGYYTHYVKITWKDHEDEQEI